MRSWYVLMATFIAILAAVAALLGSMDFTQGSGRTSLSGTNSIYDNSPCPWKLDIITIRTDSTTTEDDSMQKEEHVSYRPQGKYKKVFPPEAEG
jgi:hypothetical protein